MSRFPSIRTSALPRRIAAALAITAWLAQPLVALSVELWPACTMACSADGSFCCCKSFGSHHEVPETTVLEKAVSVHGEQACPPLGTALDPGRFSATVERTHSVELVPPTPEWSSGPSTPVVRLWTAPLSLLPRPPPTQST